MQEQPKSPRSPRKEGMATKMKKMFKPHKYEQEREEVSSGEYADAEVRVFLKSLHIRKSFIVLFLASLLLLAGL